MAIFSIKAVLQRLIGRPATEATAEVTTTETTQTVTTVEDVTVEPQATLHIPTVVERYEKDKIDVMIALASHDYGWSTPDVSIKVMLVNPTECAENPSFSIWHLVSAFRETGHSEWEFILADFLMRAVVNAYQGKLDEADISALFNRTFVAGKGKIFKPEQVRKHLSKWFEVVEVTPEGVEKMRFVINAPKTA